MLLKTGNNFTNTLLKRSNKLNINKKVIDVWFTKHLRSAFILDIFHKQYQLRLLQEARNKYVEKFFFQHCGKENSSTFLIIEKKRL